MLESVRQWWDEGFARLDSFAQSFSIPILCALLAVTAFQKTALIFHTDGGGDLLGADIPKSMMLIAGQNPYISNPWASPYPPFLLVVVGSIIRMTSGNIVLAPYTIALISRNIRFAGLVADGVVAILVYSTLRARGFTGFRALIPPGLFLALPSIGLSPYYWFNSDVFGYPILAGSILALVMNRHLIGSLLLATATVFKIHPILAVPLVIVWIVRRRGAKASLSIIVSTTLVFIVGLGLPIILPGYLESVLGFNLSSGFGGGTASFTMMNLLYGIIPSALRVSLPMAAENQVWLAATAAAFAAAFGVVWLRARNLGPIDVVTMGLLVWLIPLRQIYTHYVIWAVVPFMMRGRLRQTIIIGALLELANTLASWSWNLPPDPFPILATTDGFFVTSLVYFSVSITALVLVMRGIEPLGLPALGTFDFDRPFERYPVPLAGANRKF